MKVLTGLFWLNGVRFWVALVVIGVLFVVLGNTPGIVIGVVMLAVGVPGLVGMFRG